MENYPVNPHQSSPVNKPKFRNYLKLILLPLLILGLAGLLIIHFRPVPNPLPAAIKAQVKFQFAYPATNTYQVIASSYKYSSDKAVLSFLVTSGQNQIVVTEQVSPDGFMSPTDQLGKFHTKIGDAIVANSLVEGDSQKPGQSAVIVAEGTLIVVAASQPLNNQAWIDFFNSFKITN